MLQTSFHLISDRFETVLKMPHLCVSDKGSVSLRFETMLKTPQLCVSDKLFFMLKTLQHCVSDKLFFVYTSGTTGLPKAAVVTHTRSVQ